MKVYELVNKKMDELSDRDFWAFVEGIGTQFAVVLKNTLDVKDLAEIDQNLMPVLWQVDVVEVSPKEYMFIYDVPQLRERLYRGVS